MLQLSDVRHHFDTPGGRLDVLRGISLRVQPGQTWALTGESGSGKSTLLALAAGLDRPSSGTVHLMGHDLSRADDAARAALRRSHVGLVFQAFNLVQTLPVAANIRFQARLAGRTDQGWEAALIRRLGLADTLNRLPHQLSGGQQQRVAIARALAVRPALLLADEPTGNLDETTGDAVMALMLDLVADSGCALVMATHSTRLADRLGQKMHLVSGLLE
ncbi:ABC transporter ATP-binding protein [Yunchengibacter salinarum]|uniref:ABC transporter ATP-binding protein n=1 Tax=Yunchengibacter salinarum TaxID=3133399 RepID=UPI0035B607DA